MAIIVIKDDITYVSITDEFTSGRKIKVLRLILKYMRENKMIDFVKKGNTYFYPKEKLKELADKLFV